MASGLHVGERRKQITHLKFLVLLYFRRKREWSTFDVASHKLLALFVMEWVTHPDPKAGMFLREDLRYDIVSDELLFVELCEHSFPEGLSKHFEVNLWESGKYALSPVAVGKESMKVRMIV